MINLFIFIIMYEQHETQFYTSPYMQTYIGSFPACEYPSDPIFRNDIQTMILIPPKSLFQYMHPAQCLPNLLYSHSPHRPCAQTSKRVRAMPPGHPTPNIYTLLTSMSSSTCTIEMTRNGRRHATRCHEWICAAAKCSCRAGDAANLLRLWALVLLSGCLLLLLVRGLYLVLWLSLHLRHAGSGVRGRVVEECHDA